MKQLFFLLFVLFSLSLNGQGPADDARMKIDKYIKSRLTTKAEVITSPEMTAVFAGNFYKVDLDYTVENGGWSSSMGTMYLSNGSVKELEELSTDKELPVLLTLVNPAFRLKGEADAKILEAALDRLFPLNSIDERSRRHYFKNNLWYFIRGKFFDDEQGFVFTPDGDGKILLIQYFLKIQPAE